MTFEDPSRIEPCHLESVPPDLADTLAALAQAGAVLGARLHPLTASSLADLVSLMNAYYSNLIEGHHTRPRDIERALEGALDSGPRRDLQLEARAHVRVQREIDTLAAEGRLGEPASVEFLRWTHQRFYEGAPAAMLELRAPDGRTLTMTPGELRRGPEHDVTVGRHAPPSGASVPRFMEYFEERYRLAPLGVSRKLIAMAAAHHRLNYIHPFLDGNGRVSRLMSHAMALKAGIGASGLWSISRGLARGLEDRGEYKRMMDATDAPRVNDTDGRGNLSARALLAFVTWFVEVARDQVAFMTTLFDFERLRQRLHDYVVSTLRAGEGGALLVDEVFVRGAIARGEAARITRRPERTARATLGKLLEAGLLASATPKGPVHLRFRAASAEFLFPRLFPAEAD
jgi:Fic family protein